MTKAQLAGHVQGPYARPPRWHSVVICIAALAIACVAWSALLAEAAR